MTEPIVPKTATSGDDVAITLGLAGNDGSPGRFKRYLLLGGALLLAVLVVALLMQRRSSRGKPGYKTQEVSRGNLVAMVSATGTIQPTNQVDVGSEISGTIKTVDVDYNDRVKKGQVLARIDTARLEAQYRQNAASLESARAKVIQVQATVSEAKAKLARLVQAHEESGGKIPAKSDLDTAHATLDRAAADEANARAAVSQAEASLSAQRIDLEKSVIRSPINGIVLKRAVEPGQTVAASLQTPVLFTLAEDLTQMELRVDVDEADVGKVKAVQTASFTVAAYPDKTFPAKVSQVRFGSKTVSGVVTYETVLKVDNSTLLLRPGMTGTASITVQKVDNALLVPNSALRFTPPAVSGTDGEQKKSSGSLLGKILPFPPSTALRTPDGVADKQPRVWVIRNGVPEKITLTAGVTDGVRTEVKGGTLQQGMAVVVDIVEAGK